MGLVTEVVRARPPPRPRAGDRRGPGSLPAAHDARRPPRRDRGRSGCRSRTAWRSRPRRGPATFAGRAARARRASPAARAAAARRARAYRLWPDRRTKGEAMTYFVTGATGFIGRHLVERLLEREGQIHVLVREPARASASTPSSSAGARARPSASCPSSATWRGRAPGRRRRPGSTPTAGKVDHFFHLAAMYDMTAPTRSATSASTSSGTRNASRSPTRSTAGIFTTSPRSRPPAPYKGLFREDMFDEGQKLDHRLPPHEVRVREASPATRRRRRGASTGRRSSSATRRPARWTRSTAPTTSSRRSRSCATTCRSGCRSSAPSSATRTSSPSTTSPRRSTTSPTSPTSTGRPSTSPPRSRSARARS